METNQSTSGGTAEFYLPGTIQFSRSPGRLERFLTRHLRSREVDGAAAGSSHAPEFYLPATPGVRAR